MGRNGITFASDFKDAVIEKQIMWFFDNHLQALCKLNIKTEEMEIVSLYDYVEEFFVIWMYATENKFYFTSNNSLRILVYDRGLKRFTLIDNIKDIGSVQTYSFWNEKSIWFIPQYPTGRLCRFEIETMKFIHVPNVFEEELSKIKEKTEIAIVFPNGIANILLYLFHHALTVSSCDWVSFI